MLASNSSRSSSVFSIGTSLTSSTSYPHSPISPLDCEKAPIDHPSKPLVLQWKPLLFSAAFTYDVSTRLHFTAFPPHDLQRPLFEQLSHNAAQALLLEYMAPSTLSPFAQPTSKIVQVGALSWPSSLPHELIACLQGDHWDYFSVTGTTVPLGMGKLSTSFDHQVAIRPIQGGVERYILGPAGLCIHSVCRLHDAGVRIEETIPRETLFLWEETEVVCHKLLRKWTKSLLASHIAASHEQFRMEWDAGIRSRWSLMTMKQNIDLLA